MAEKTTDIETGKAANIEQPANDTSDTSETNLVLQFSGTSDDLDSTNGSKNIIVNLSNEYNVELEEHVSPVSSVKAIRTDHQEHMLSDDENPKVLTTLETVKKQSTIAAEVKVEEMHADEHEDEEGTVLVEVCTDDNGHIDEKADTAADDAKKLAEMQLGDINPSNIRGRPRKHARNSIETETKTDKSKKGISIRSNSDTEALKIDRVKHVKGTAVLSSTIFAKKEDTKKDVESNSDPLTCTPIKKPSRLLNRIESTTRITPLQPIPVLSSGTIEIPRELLLSEAEIATSPVILNHVNNSNKKLDNDELIAILEGDGDLKLSNVEHFEVSMEEDGNLLAVAKNSQGNLSKDEEREIAIQQMLNLPTKKKGRPKLDPSKKVQKPTKQTKRGKTDQMVVAAGGTSKRQSELVNALVSDWSDNDFEGNKDDHQTETEIVIEINQVSEPQTDVPTPKKRKSIPVEVPQPTFKRSRVIKKKIIWDPDAPETAINYASYAHTSGPGPQKKPLVKKASPVANPVQEQDPQVASSPTASLKKKKTSEIDKLLGDEGAINMLNSLNQENNNTENPSTKPARKITKPEPYDAIIHSIPRVKTPRKDASSPKGPVGSGKKESGTGATAPKKRGPKPSSSSSSTWDYVYSARPDDSMIIRRRSNSSYSSTASANRSSMDLANAPPIIDNDGQDFNSIITVEPVKKKARNSKEKEKVFEFAKPIAKKPIKTEAEALAHESILTDIRGKFNKAISGEAKRVVRNKSISKDNGSFVPMKVKKDNNLLDPENVGDVAGLDSILASYSELTLKWHRNCVQMILSPKPAGNGGRYKNLFTIQLMKEISSALRSLDLDKTCKAVVIMSANNSFCGGIDFTTLIQATAEKRRFCALELAKTSSTFLQTLSEFKKPLIGAVTGRIIGIGVSILPLFDVIIAREDASFEILSPLIGHVPEGISVFSTTNKLNQNIKNELLYLNDKVTSVSALKQSLVTKVFKTDKFIESVIAESEKLASRSSQSIEAIKSALQQKSLPALSIAIQEERKLLVEHWTSVECQEKYQNYLITEEW